MHLKKKGASRLQGWLSRSNTKKDVNNYGLVLVVYG